MTSPDSTNLRSTSPQSQRHEVRRATREAEGRHVDDYFEGVTHTPRDPDFERRVRESFARQAAMQTLGITLARVSPGEVVLELPFRDDLTQEHGFLHAGV